LHDRTRTGGAGVEGGEKEVRNPSFLLFQNYKVKTSDVNL